MDTADFWMVVIFSGTPLAIGLVVLAVYLWVLD